MADAIKIEGLTKSFKNFTLGPIDLALPTGCVMGLIGENGAGKSTLISLLLGMKRPDAGRALVLGEEAGSDNAHFRSKIGVVLDIPGFPSAMRASEIGKLLAPGFPDWDGELFRSLCAGFQLPEKTNFGEYSRGMKMKLSIATALAHHPELLILDEPTGGLDPVARDEILDIFYNFIQSPDRSILISSHILSDLEKICDYIAFLHEGRLLLQGEKDVLKETYGLMRGSRAEIAALPEEAVKGVRRTGTGDEALVLRDYCPAAEPADLEELMVFMLRYAKGENAR